MHELDQHILDLRKDKEMLLALERLLINPDFKKVILDGFLVKHPLALVQSKGVIPLDAEVAKGIDRQLDCVALFKLYLSNQEARIKDIDIKINEAEILRDEQTRNT